MRTSLVSLALVIVACGGGRRSASPTPPSSPDAAPTSNPEPTVTATDDPYLWLEDVTGDKPLAWVKEHNAKSQTNQYVSDEL